jgi:hypothetical protein
MKIGPAKLGPDPQRDDMVSRIASIASRHHHGDQPTREDVAYLLDIIARLPHGVAVAFLDYGS